MNLDDLARQRTLTTEEKCIAYLEKMRWPEGVRCPACGNSSISHFQSKGKSGKPRYLYQCLDKMCRYQFSPTTGTIFHDSHLPLNKWFRAITLVSDAQKPMSVNQLRLALAVQYKTAVHLADRIRQAMENGSIELAAEQVLTASSAAPLGRKVNRPERSGTRENLSSPTGAPHSVASTARVSGSIAERRADTATILSQITAKPGSQTVSNTAVDNMLSMFVSLAQLSVRPPLFFVNYLRDKVFT
ncbi:MAG: transposase [Acidobacteria bacterium]|nr:transposase [Acidobacteriota bacterium]